MSGVETLTPPLPDPAVRNARLFAGAIAVLTDVPAVATFIDRARDLVFEAFGPDDPQTAHDRFPPDQLAAKAQALLDRFRADGQVRALFPAMMTALGEDPDDCHFDHLYLRVSPSGMGHGHRRTRALWPHRDSWGSNLYAQVNWWAPVLPIIEGNGLALYPDYWRRPLPNTTADWDFEAMKRARKAAHAQGLRGADLEQVYPTVPSGLAAPEEEGRIVPVPEPGQILAFSAAHLHASVPNRTGRTRYSFETRTVSREDVRAGRGAPNVDGAAPGIQWGWFQRLSDAAALTPP